MTERTGPAEAGGTILLIDDDDAIRQAARRTLERAGFTVRAIPTAREALEYLVSHDKSVALIITDLAMPGMSGVVLARRAAEWWPHIRLLIMSGYPAEPDLIAPGSSAQYLEKPFTPTQLVERVKAMLRDAEPGQAPE
jgi:two-component system cell cycle sensor histidine kinase/response regulator CckA